MNSYTSEEIAKLTGGTILRSNGKSPIERISTDTRIGNSIPNSLFVALVGANHDGHDHIQKAYDLGCRDFLVERDVGLTNANVIKVENSLDALQTFATAHRKRSKVPVIGITGSNGKTIVKEWLYQLLRHEYNIIRSPKSYNSQLGVALSVLQMEETHELAIFEAGISTTGEMERLAGMIEPTIGIITNIGESHSAGFNSKQEKLAEKTKLFQNARTIVYRADDDMIRDHVQAAFSDKELIGWTIDDVPPTFKLKDEASRENIGHCIAVMKHLGIATDAIDARLADITPIAMRLEIMEGINNCLLLNDSYNSDLGSLTIALNVIGQQRGNRPVIVILSDILQDKASSEVLYGKVAQVLLDNKVSKLVAIGPQLSTHKDRFTDITCFPDTESFIRAFDESSFSDAAIVLKGARSFKFERIARLLQKRSHETVLEIGLPAIRHNFQTYRALLNSGTKIMAMVKAYSYGAGGAEIAKTLELEGADYLGVAYADEGVALRKAGVNLPIMVTNADAVNFDSLILNDLAPEIYSLEQLDSYIRAVIDHGRSGLPVHVKLETGMNRQGITGSDLEALIANIKAQPEVRIESVFTHLAASDLPDEDEFSRSQVDRFKAMASRIEAAFDHDILKHVLNTAGISRFPEAQLDMVRLGIGLYGVDVTGKHSLQIVGRLRTRITQVKHVPAGETVGYDRSARVDSDSRIGIIPIGYADGISRTLSNGVGQVAVNGSRAPFIGRICMDLSMIDISGIDAEVGDEVEIFGEVIALQEVAKAMNTIPYEVLSGIPQRVKRIYITE